MPEEKEFIPIIDVNIKNLPSRGVPYTPNAKLSYRTYTYGEVKSVSTSSMTTERTLKRTLSGLIASFDVMTLTLMDAMYLGIMRKISSFSGMEFELPFICRNSGCKHQNSAHFTHKDLVFKDLPDDVTELPICVSINDIEYEFAPITVGEFLDLNSGKYDRFIKDKLDPMAIYARNVKNMDFEKSFKELSKVNNPEDIELLEDVDKLLLHALEPLNATCTKCKNVSKIKLEGQEAFLSPFRGRGKVNRSRISFGNASTS